MVHPSKGEDKDIKLQKPVIFFSTKIVGILPFWNFIVEGRGTQLRDKVGRRHILLVYKEIGGATCFTFQNKNNFHRKVYDESWIVLDISNSGLEKMKE